MKITTFKYFFSDAVKSLKRNVTLTIGSVITISATFFIVGLFLLYMILLNKNSATIFIINKQAVTIFRYVGVAVFLIVPPLSLLLIVNEIKMVVFSRRCEISIMKSVGATDWFIRWPFIIEGLVIGIIGAFVANLALFCAYSLICTIAKEFLTEISLVQPIFIIKTMILPFVIAGAFIVPIASIIALRKVLNCAVLES